MSIIGCTGLSYLTQLVFVPDQITQQDGLLKANAEGQSSLLRIYFMAIIFGGNERVK
jgi:hypothetical protein